jgi:hypothetical protein
MHQERSRSSAVETDSRYDERQLALAPYLERLTAPEVGPPPLHPAIGLNQWELGVLEEGLAQKNGNDDRWPTLLAESIAFQSKYFAETDEMDREECTPPESIERHRETLTFNAAIGLALMEEIQRVIDTTILSGNMGHAKRLTGFRNKVAQTVKAVKDRISPEDYQDAESIHTEMLAPVSDGGQTIAAAMPMLDIDPNEANQQRPPALRERDEGPPKPIRMDRNSNLKLGHAVEVEEKTNYSKWLLIVLGTLLLAWSILILPRMFKEPLPLLTMPDLPQSTALQALDAKPPSLYVVVDKQSWTAMPSEQRLEWVEAVGQTAAAAGYTGVSVRTGEGACVAQWLKQKGTQLLTSAASGS